MRENGHPAKGFGLVKKFLQNLPFDTIGHQRAAAYQLALVPASCATAPATLAMGREILFGEYLRASVS